MRLATIVDDRRGLGVGIVREDGIVVLPADEPQWASIRAIAGKGTAVLSEIAGWLAERERGAVPLESVTLGPAVPDPGAIYTIGHNYRSGDGPDEGPDRPLVYGKAASSVGAPGATLSWDRTITDNVDAEVELGVVIGAEAWAVPPEDAMRHVFGYTCVNDVSSRDPWLDGDQWLIGKSMPGFCPIGPWIVTADELDPSDLQLTCAIDGEPIQDGRTSAMRFGIRDVVAYVSRHVVLRPGDVILTGTPERLATSPGPGRRLRTGDDVTVAIQEIGTLTTHIR
jgi:2-keto-4-pentenoate hydratase/2-oxohepta-3-ene-1,7-dioic acid hydratase in catechol pathway